MPTPTRRGYSSNQEFIDFKKRLEELKNQGTITDEAFQDLLTKSKVDVETFLKPIAPAVVPAPTLPKEQRPLPTPLPRPLVPASDVSAEIGKKAVKEAERLPPSVPFGEGVTEEQKKIIERIGGPRSPSGKKETNILPVVGQQQEPTSWADVFSRQELVFPEDKKALEESGLVGEGLSTLLFKEDEDSRIVESNVAYLGRILGIPSEIIAATGETAVSPKAREKGFEKTLQKRIKKGEGLAGAGSDIGEALEEALDLPAGSASYPLWFVGLIADYYVPSTSEFIAVPLKIAKNARQINAIRKQLQGFSSPLVDAVDALFKSSDNVAKRAVANFATDPINLMDATDVIRTQDLNSGVRLGIVGKATTGELIPNLRITDAGFADAIANAPTPEIKAEIIDAYKNFIGTAYKDQPISKFTQGLVDNASLGLTAGTRTAEDAQAAEELLSHSILKATAQKQLSGVEEFVSKQNPDIQLGKVILPANEARRVSETLGQITAPVRVTDQVNRALEAGKKPTIILPPKFIKATEELGLPIKTKEVVVTTGGVKSKQQVVDLTDWNKWVESSVEQVAERSPQVRKTIREDKGVIAKLRETKPIATVETKVKETLEKLPSFKRALEIEKTFSIGQKATLQKARQQLSAIGDEFKRKVNLGVKEGKTKQEAFADVVIGDYGTTPNLKEVVVDGKTFFRDPKGIEPDISKGDLVGDLFDDFIATIYGAEDKVVQASKTFGFGKSFPGTDPVAFRKGLEEIYENPGNVLSTAKAEFIDLVEQGKNKEATEFLYKLHQGLEGRPLNFAGLTTKVDDTITPIIPSSRAVDALSFTYLNRKSGEVIASAAVKEQPLLTQLQEIQKLRFETLQDKLKESLTLATPTTQVDPATLRPLKSTRITGATSDPDAYVKSLVKNRPDYIKELRTYITAPVGDQREIGAVTRLATKIYDDVGVDNPLVKDALTQVLEAEFKDAKSQLLGFGRIALPELDLIRPKDAIANLADAVLLGVKGTKPRTPSELITVMKQTKTGKLIMEELETARNLAQASKTMEDLKSIPKTVIADLDEGKSSFDIIEQIKQLDLKQGVSPRLLRFVGLVTDPTALFKATGKGIGKAATLIKSGMLAGSILPNFAYHAQNILTAPLIINSTLGGKRALEASKNLLFLDPKVNRAVDELFAVTYGPGKVTETLRGPKSGLIKTQSGKVYTPTEIAELVAKNGVVMTADKADLSRNLLEDFAKWSGKNLKGQDVGKARQFLREWNPTKPNVWFEMANYFDTRFRTGVLVKALEEGKTEAEALQMARDALFDYGKISDFEKQTIGRLLWFWSFERSSITQAVKNLINNPKRFLNENRLQHALPEDNEIHSADSDYRQNNIFLKLVKDNKEDYNVYGPEVPQASGLAKLTDYIGALFPFIGGEKLLKVAAERAGASSLVTLPLAVFGREFNRGEISDPSSYVDPRILGWVKANPQVEALFNSYVKLEPIPPEELTNTSMTFGGLGYRIPFDDERSKANYNRILELAKTVGLERTLRDYAPIVQGERPGEFTPTTLEIDDGMLEFLRDIGVIKVGTEKTGEQVRSAVREQIQREIKK